MQQLTLYELNHMVSQALALTFNEELWVVAEIAELREAASAHCYMELVEKDDRRAGHFRARARANAWRNTWMRIQAQFHAAAGRSLSVGLKVLLRVRVELHEAYGYALTVTEIDPNYTLGDLAARRQEILAQLEEDGVLTLNRELPVPRPLQRIAVVSAAHAAGYGDFAQQLADSPFRFETKLFTATMQGREVESSLIAALDRIAAQAQQWDVVVIIRGGGATTDLDGFETYLLAANVAQFPLPIFTGIGHERDDTVLDFVAHTRFKTPTAVAAFLIEHMQEEQSRLSTLRQRLLHATHHQLHATRQQFDRLAHRYQLSAQQLTARRRQQLQQRFAQLQRAVSQQLHQAQATQRALALRLQHAVHRRIDREQHQLDLLAHSLTMASPERLLRMGYSLTTDAEGRPLSSAGEAAIAQNLITHFHDGQVRSTVTATTLTSDPTAPEISSQL